MFLKRGVRQLDCPRRSFSEILKSEMWDYQKMKGGSAKSGAGQNIGGDSAHIFAYNFQASCIVLYWVGTNCVGLVENIRLYILAYIGTI